VLSVEIFIQSSFQLILHSLKKTSGKVFKVLQSNNISDHWKEKVILKYSLILFKRSLKALFVLLFIVFIFLSVSYFDYTFIYFSISLIGIIESILVCFIYVKIRNIIFE